MSALHRVQLDSTKIKKPDTLNVSGFECQAYKNNFIS
jgi:hypothetical protein